jgi:hypothetical protein
MVSFDSINEVILGTAQTNFKIVMKSSVYNSPQQKLAVNDKIDKTLLLLPINTTYRNYA